MLSYVVDTHPAESLYMRITVEIFQKWDCSDKQKKAKRSLKHCNRGVA